MKLNEKECKKDDSTKSIRRVIMNSIARTLVDLTESELKNQTTDHIDSLAPWDWCLEYDGRVLEDDGENLKVRFPDGSLAAWKNAERAWVEIVWINGVEGE